MYYYVYQIENIINGKIYIGKHSTSDLDDGYMGSGVLLNKAIKKYGIENFRKIILQVFDSGKDALAYEKELVTEEFLSRDDVYNLNLGGRGSWRAANLNYPKEKRAENGRKTLEKLRADPAWRLRKAEIDRESLRKLREEGRIKVPDWTGKKHREETKRKIGQSNSIAQRGERNSQFGKVWITNLEEKVSTRVPKDELEDWLSKGWIKGRKMKF
jgi:hypothetical protein